MMHCPRCGQSQVSEEIKFCSRCGFPLALVSELLAHDGFLPQLADAGRNKKLLTRNNGLKFGLVWFLLMTFLITPILAIAGGDEIVALTGVLGFMGGILIMLFSWLFLPSKAKLLQPAAAQPTAPAPNYFKGAANQTALPPPQSLSADSYIPPTHSWKAPDTGDLAQPPSITEPTTKLLTKDE